MAKGERGIGMEGWSARSYAKLTHKHMTEFEQLADLIAESLEPGSAILEVAPGPGYLALELAKRQLNVTGLDISKTFVELARGNAASAGESARFELGNASAMPFPDVTFDFVVCRAAFKNFSDPVGALREMKRVLKPGGKGLIVDLCRDVPMSEIMASVYGGGRFTLFEKLSGRLIFTFLRRRAYTSSEMHAMLGQATLAKISIERAPAGMNVFFER